VDSLAGYLNDSDAGVRRAAATALRSIARKAAAALAPFLSDADMRAPRAALAFELALPEANQDRRGMRA